MRPFLVSQSVSTKCNFKLFLSTLFFLATFATLRSVITVELLGLEKLNSAFGLLLLFQGLAVTIGSPIAGIYCFCFRNIS